MKHYVIRTKTNEYKLVSREQYLSVYNDCIVVGRYFMKFYAEIRLSELIENNNPYKDVKHFLNLIGFVFLFFNAIPYNIVQIFNYTKFVDIFSSSIILIFLFICLYKTFTVVFDMFTVEYKHLYKLIYDKTNDDFKIVKANEKIEFGYKLNSVGNFKNMYKESVNPYNPLKYKIFGLSVYMIFYILWIILCVDFNNLYFYTDFSGCTVDISLLTIGLLFIALELNKAYTIVKYFIKK